MFRGLPITAVRDFPSHGVYFALYELGQNWMTPGRATTGWVALSAFPERPACVELTGGGW